MLRQTEDRADVGSRRCLQLGRDRLHDELSPTADLVRDVTGAAEVRVTLLGNDAECVVAGSGPTWRGGHLTPREPRLRQQVVTEDRPVVEPSEGGGIFVGVPVIGGEGVAIGSLSGVLPLGYRMTSVGLGRWQQFRSEERRVGKECLL